MCVYSACVQVSIPRPEEGIESPSTGITGACELPEMGHGPL